MNDTRTDTARQHDDSELIEGTAQTPPQGGRSGGDLAKDISAPRIASAIPKAASASPRPTKWRTAPIRPKIASAIDPMTAL